MGIVKMEAQDEVNELLTKALAKIKTLPPSRINSLAATKIEEAQLWLNAQQGEHQ